jgi:hypothetical protein
MHTCVHGSRAPPCMEKLELAGQWIQAYPAYPLATIAVANPDLCSQLTAQPRPTS